MSSSHPPDIVKRLQQHLGTRPEILEAYLFGSQARGRAKPHSDLDVAVFIDEATSPTSPYGYGADLAADLMRVCERDDVDVIVLNSAPPLLYQRVLRDGIRVCSRDLAATTACCPPPSPSDSAPSPVSATCSCTATSMLIWRSCTAC